MDILLFDIRIFVDPSRVKIAKTAALSNALLNTNSGTITIGEYTFCGQNVSIITGTHDYSLLGKDRMESIPQEGQDIIIGNGVWIGSNATILGPCVIGDNAVVASGAVVTNDVAPYDIVAGVPARRIGQVQKK
jgi:acetyltransferase-like isoleucine patch superfamily enzyme